MKAESLIKVLDSKHTSQTGKQGGPQCGIIQGIPIGAYFRCLNDGLCRYLATFRAFLLFFFLRVWTFHGLFEIFLLGLDIVFTNGFLLAYNLGVSLTLFTFFWQFFGVLGGFFGVFGNIVGSFSVG